MLLLDNNFGAPYDLAYLPDISLIAWEWLQEPQFPVAFPSREFSRSDIQPSKKIENPSFI